MKFSERKPVAGCICETEGCEGPVKARGMCKAHYYRWYRLNAEPCSVAGCEKPVSAKEMCSAHYRRVLKYGDVRESIPIGLGMGTRLSRGTAEARFFFALRWDLIADSQRDCWIWEGACRGAYPRINDAGRSLGAHVWAYERWNGHVPNGWHIDHICGQKHCVNPAHLEAVPNQVNILRGMADSIRESYGAKRLEQELSWVAEKARAERYEESGVWHGIE